MVADRLAQCAWPPLPEPFATALRAAVQFIFAEVDPVGIVATGTIVRGEGHPNSDLDIYVVHLAPFRRRVQQFSEGVPTEIFINPPSAIRAYFIDEDRDGRRLTAHMLATGVVLYRSDPVVDDIRTEAREWLARRTLISDAERTHTRYSLATRLEDGLDVAGTDDVTATMLLTDTVTAMLEYACRVHDGQIPRRKDLIAVVGARAPDVARLAQAFSRAATVTERVEHAVQLADQIIGARGFFPWDSGPEPISE
jgi:predicted nucleotidyltransferase